MWRVLSITAGFLAFAAFITACSDSEEAPAASGRNADLEDEVDAPSTTEDGGILPQTIFGLTSISSVESPSDIAQVMGYAEGGDDPCGSDSSGLELPPRIVDAAFNESEVVQIGWGYSLCWGESVTDEELVDPEGLPVEPGASGIFPLLPGSPTGTYLARATADGSVVEAEIEVVEATEPRLFDDPSIVRAPTEGDPTTRSDLLAYLVGFEADTDVPVALYEGGDGEVGRLMGVARVETDETGSASLLVEREDLSSDLCVTLVADPEAAVDRWGDRSELEPGLEGYYFENTAQMILPACFAPD